MKKLQYTFTANYDKMGEMNFTQKKRNGNVAMYERNWQDGRFCSYEVFLVKTVKAGAKLPNGCEVVESYEVYPTKNHFGKTAYSVSSIERAEKRFSELQDTVRIKEENPGVRRGRKSTVTAEVVIPTDRFTMVELFKENVTNGWTKPMLYLRLQALVKDGTLKCVGVKPNKIGRGKPSKIYKKV